MYFIFHKEDKSLFASLFTASVPVQAIRKSFGEYTNGKEAVLSPSISRWILV